MSRMKVIYERNSWNVFCLFNDLNEVTACLTGWWGAVAGKDMKKLLDKGR